MIAAAARCLGAREVGALLVAGPWQDLGRGQWGVPAVGCMSKCPRPDYVIEAKDSGFVWVKPRREERHEEADPLAAVRR